MRMQQKTQQLKQITLEALKFKAQNNIGRYMVENMSIEINDVAISIANEFIYELETKILGQQNVQKYHIPFDIPKNWWEHFKQDIMPGWFKEKFPVKLKKVEKEFEFNHMALLPDLNISSEQGRVVMYTQPSVATDTFYRL